VLSELDHAARCLIRMGGAGEAGNGRLPRPEDARRQAIEVVGDAAVGHELIDQLGRLDKRLPLAGKGAPWEAPEPPEDPAVERPFAWLGDGAEAAPISDAIPLPPFESGHGRADGSSE